MDWAGILKPMIMKGVTKRLPFRLGSICLDHYGAVKIDSLNSSCYVNGAFCTKVHQAF